MLKQTLELMEQNFLGFVLGLFGGMIRDLNSESFSFRLFIIGTMTSAFIAVFVSLLIGDMDISDGFKAAIIGISGYCAKYALEMFERWFRYLMQGIEKRFKANVDSNAGPEDKDGGDEQ
jgi:hypothetical protein